MPKYAKSINRVIKVKQGYIRGVPSGNPAYTVFKGVPYAKPPVGQYRFKHAQAVDNWEGIRDCTCFPNISIQNPWEEGSFYQKEFFCDPPRMSEDCLYLNIWTSDTSGTKRMPILFWIHGGGNVAGYSFEPEFDGEAFLRRGCILVTINYRLGVYGFFAHPELTKRDGYSGNYGLSDIIKALEWVNENAPAFGGDPDNITVFGQSAGGGLTKNLLMSKKAKGLYKRATVQSSGGIGSPGMTAALSQKEEIGKKAADAAGCTLDDMMHEDAFELYKKLRTAAEESGARGPFSPCVDGLFLEEGLYETFTQGKYHDVDIMMGCVAGDNSLFGRDGVKMTRRIAEFGENAIKTGHKPMYLYYFDRMMPGDDAGAFHSAELWYVFGTLDRCWRAIEPGFTAGDWLLSNAMTDYWCAFAKTGDPNNAKQSKWQPYKGFGGRIMHMNERIIAENDDSDIFAL